MYIIIMMVNLNMMMINIEYMICDQGVKTKFFGK